MKTNLFSLRTNRNLSRKELAKAIGVQDYNVADWENGRTEPSLTKIIALADFFDVSVDFLIGRSFKDDCLCHIYEGLSEYIRTFQNDTYHRQITELIDNLNDKDKRKVLDLLKHIIKDFI